MLPVAILAGGLGTRIAPLTVSKLPKVLLPVAARPFIDFKLAGLAAEGVREVVLLIGHLGHEVRKHVGDGGRYGLRVHHLDDGPQLLGTGGAIRRALPLLGRSFWVTYGDTYLRLPLADAEDSWRNSGRAGLMTVLRNRDRWDRSNVRLAHGVVAEYRKGAPPGTYEYIDYGISILPSEAFLVFDENQPLGLEAVIELLVSRGELAAFAVEKRFYHIGSPEGYVETDAFFRWSGESERLQRFITTNEVRPRSH